jgi:hypothetical protein
VHRRQKPLPSVDFLYESAYYEALKDLMTDPIRSQSNPFFTTHFTPYNPLTRLPWQAV